MIHGVEGRFAILAGSARFLVAADEEDRVVRPGGHHQQGQQVGRVRRQPDDAGVAEEGDDAARGGHLDEDRGERQQRGEHRAVDEEQHQRDHADGDRGDLGGALATDVELVGDQRGGAGDVGLEPRRPRGVVDDIAKRANGFVGQRRTLVARRVHLDVGGLAVAALRARRGQRVTPVVLDVFDVLVVLLEFADQRVVIAVGVRAERLVTLQDDHGGAVGVELVERLADRLDCLERRRIWRIQRDVVGLADLFELRHRDVGDRGQRDPEQQDRQGEAPNGARYPRPLGSVSAHRAVIPTCLGRRCRRRPCGRCVRP